MFANSFHRVYFHLALSQQLIHLRRVLLLTNRSGNKSAAWSLLLLVAVCTPQLIRLHVRGGVEMCDISVSNTYCFRAFLVKG